MAEQKHRITVTLPRKPRNPFVVDALTRRAGSHDKPHKAARQQTRQHLQRVLGALLRSERTEFEID